MCLFPSISCSMAVLPTPKARIVEAEAEIRAAQKEMRQALSELREVQRWMNGDAAGNVLDTVVQDGDVKHRTDYEPETQIVIATSSLDAVADDVAPSPLMRRIRNSSPERFSEAPSMTRQGHIVRRKKEMQRAISKLQEVRRQQGRSSSPEDWRRAHVGATTVNTPDRTLEEGHSEPGSHWDWEQESPLSIVAHSVRVMTKQAQELTLRALDIVERALEEGRDSQCYPSKPDSQWTLSFRAVTEEILDFVKVAKVGMKAADSTQESSFLVPSVVAAPSSTLSRAPSASFVPENPSACNLIQSMFMNEETADIVFHVGTSSQTIFPAHRFILQQCAPTMTQLCAPEGDTAPIFVMDVAPGVFRLLLGHVYGKKWSTADLTRKARELIEAANKYRLVYLKIEAYVNIPSPP